MPAERILAKLRGEPWVIQPDWLSKMIQIAERMNDVEALEARKGAPLEYAYEATVRDGVAILPIEGPIFPKANMMTEMSGATALSLVARDFTAALDNDAISSIVLRINSPGGQSTGIDEMASMIRNADKPVHAHVSGTGASAAYWIASAADSISLSPTSSVGSIGVAYTTRAAQDGEESDIIEFVSSLSPKKRLSPRSEEGEEQIMSLIDGMAEVFISDVATGRNTSSEDVLENFGQGGMVLAQKAVEVGMADHVGTFEELMANLSGQTTSSYGDYQMDIKELKAKHNDVYLAIFQEGVESAEEAHQTVVLQLQTDNAELTTQNESLTEKLSAEQEAAKQNEDRIVALEKKDAIRQAKAVKATADEIVASNINSSNIPKGLHKKVKASINHEEFLSEDGELDIKAFKASVKEEVADWSANLTSASPLGGNLGDGGTEASDDNKDAEVDTNVERLLSHIQ